MARPRVQRLHLLREGVCLSINRFQYSVNSGTSTQLRIGVSELMPGPLTPLVPVSSESMRWLSSFCPGGSQTRLHLLLTAPQVSCFRESFSLRRVLGYPSRILVAKANSINVCRQFHSEQNYRGRRTTHLNEKNCTRLQRSILARRFLNNKVRRV